MTKQLFEDLGYHLDVFCVQTGKYEGSIKVNTEEVDDNPLCGYASRKIEKLNHIGKKGNNIIHFQGTYRTELIPLCGKAIKNFNNFK